MSLNAFLSNDFKAVQSIIESEISPDKVLIKKKSYDLFLYGGKKIRQTFTLLVGKLGNKKYAQDILKIAASLELIHMATLVHDDIIDDSDVRRGHITVYYSEGYNQAILTGNYLLSIALKLSSEVDNMELHRVYAQAIQTIVEGELNQFEQQFNADITKEAYFEKTYRKTALLIETSVALGAIASHLQHELKEKLMRYAYHIGMSFQIIDDCLDFIGIESEIGKPKFSDLKNGHYTLPVILLRDKDPSFHEQLHQYSKQLIQVDDIINAILDSGVIDEALSVSNQHIDEAIVAIDGIDDEIKHYLIEFAEKLQKRIS